MPQNEAGAIDEQERRRKARGELAVKLGECLNFALVCGLQSEAVVIAKLIDATIQNTTIDLVLKLK